MFSLFLFISTPLGFVCKESSRVQATIVLGWLSLMWVAGDGSIEIVLITTYFCYKYDQTSKGAAQTSC